MDFKGKRAIVLGGTSGIGLAVTERLAAAGAEVIAGSRSEAKLNAVNGLSGVGGRPIDVLDRGGLESLFADLDPFDILVNSATGGERVIGPFLEMDLDGYQSSFRKLWGYVNSVRLGTSHMSEQGAICLVGGIGSRRCFPGAIGPASAAGALESFVRGVARELAPRRINAVAPGVIDTPIFALPDQDRANFLEQATNRQPLPRAGTADEVAQAILLTLANDFMTGAVIDVDGGALVA